VKYLLDQNEEAGSLSSTTGTTLLGKRNVSDTNSVDKLRREIDDSREDDDDLDDSEEGDDGQKRERRYVNLN
jgi:hypothetical protein